MNSFRRPIISLPKRDTLETTDEPVVMLDRFEVLLPCRLFQITYKVAEKGGASITSEFLLRLLFAVDGMEELAIAEFFGFDQRELAFVMNEVTARDYVFRSDGRVWLTSMGRGLFKDGKGTPHILSVDKRADSFGFDLLSLCPQEPDRLDRFALSLPELPIMDPELLSNATRHISTAFQRHFAEFDLSRRGGGYEKQQYLYSVDSVSPEEKFLAVVPVTINAQGGRSSMAEFELTEWRSGHELEDRERIAGAVAAYMDRLKKPRQPHDAWAYEQLIKLAPEFLADFIRRDGLAVERFHKSAVARAGELRSDRPTIPLLGSLFTSPNTEKLLNAIKYAIKRHETEPPQADRLCWLVPSLHWGSTRVLPKTLDAIRKTILKEGGAQTKLQEFRFIAVRPDREMISRHRLLEAAFDERMYLDESCIQSSNLEILWIPGLMVAVLVHAPIRAAHAFPTPLGILSFDPIVVERSEMFFTSMHN